MSYLKRANPRRAIAATAVLGLAGVVTVLAVRSGREAEPEPALSLDRIAPVSLTTAHTCDDLLAYYRKHAARLVGPYGLGGGWAVPAVARDLAAASGRSFAGAEAGANVSGKMADAGAQSATGTNVQVAGVDESDQMKVQGDLMVSAVNNVVRITRLAGDGTRTLGSWKPERGSVSELLVHGTKAVAIGEDSTLYKAANRLMPGAPPDPKTVLTLLDLADPEHPKAVRRVEIDGSRAGQARLVGGELRLAVSAGPHDLKWVQPEYPTWDAPRRERPDPQEAEEKATKANRKVAAGSTIENWLPGVKVTSLDASGDPAGSAERERLVDCAQVALPESFSGLQTLAMVAMDLDGDTPLGARRGAGVVAAGSTLYATADRSWLATSQWSQDPASGATTSMFVPTATRTDIHLFETPKGDQPRYLASGAVAGSLLSQFAMDERDGVLRVASTTEGTGRTTPDEDDAGTGDAPDSGSTGSGAAGTGSSGSGAADSGSTGSGVSGSEAGAVGSGASGTGTGSKSGTDAEVREVAPAAPADAVAAQEPAGPEGVAPVGTDVVEPAPATPATPSVPATSSAPATPGDAVVDPDAPVSGPAQPEPRPTPDTEARVTILRADGDRLTQVGVVTGLGKGERIRGVRFAGDLGYVITYRQTDPLYAVDLTDPARPRVTGELAVLGYSAYLHPVAGSSGAVERLIGLGQDGTEDGRTTGLQLSLFDVADPARLRRLDAQTLPDAWSDVEGDHHAFTMSGDLVLVPYTSWQSEPVSGAAEEPGSGKGDGATGFRTRFDAGVIAVRVGAESFGTPATLRPVADGPLTYGEGPKVKDSVRKATETVPMRTTVRDDIVYTLTGTGVSAHSATGFERLTFAEF